MKKFLFKSIFFGFLVFSCAEKEDIDTFYGEYLPQSIVSEQLMDITGDGAISMDLLEQLKNSNDWPGINSGIIKLTLVGPPSYHFSKVILSIPSNTEFNNEVIIYYAHIVRRFDLDENGTVSLDWNQFNFPNRFDYPQQILEDVFVDTLIINQGRNYPVQLVLNQKWYDFSKKDWVETKVYYIFWAR